MFVNGPGWMSNLYRGSSIDASIKFQFICPSVFKSANQKQELPMVAMFVNGSGQYEQS